MGRFHAEPDAIGAADHFNKVKDGLFEIEGDGGNVAVLVTSEGVILVDD